MKRLFLLALAALPAWGACPPPALMLPPTGCRLGSAVAAVEPIDGASYAWAIEGGTLVAGAGTERVTIAIGSGKTLKVTLLMTTPSCGSSSAVAFMALDDPFTIASFDAGSGKAGEQRTITWSFQHGQPAVQILSGTDLAPISLPAAARSYTYTPVLFGDKSVILQASQVPIAARTRAVGRGTGAASGCSAARAEAKFHVDCTLPAATIAAPAATGVGMPFTARVQLVPGATASWTIANGTPATAAGDSVTIQPLTGEPVDVNVIVTAETCRAAAAARVRVDPALGCANVPAAELSLAASDCERGTIAVRMSGMPPFSGTWSDGVPFAANGPLAERTVTAAGNYTINGFRDALCAGRSGVLTYTPKAPTATVGTNGSACIGSAAVVTFTGTPPFLGEWSDGVSFNTAAMRLERTIAEPAELSLKWVQDANCSGTVAGRAAFGRQGTASVRLQSPSNGCLMVDDPATPAGAIAAVDLVGRPPFSVTWFDGTTQTSDVSPIVRTFAFPAGSAYSLGVTRARDAFCDMNLLVASVPLQVTIYPRLTPVPGVCPWTTTTVSMTSSVPASSQIAWHVTGGTIVDGQGTPYVKFMPDAGAAEVLLTCGIVTPDLCTGTNSLRMNVYATPAKPTLLLPGAVVPVGYYAFYQVKPGAQTARVYLRIMPGDVYPKMYCQDDWCGASFAAPAPGTYSVTAYAESPCSTIAPASVTGSLTAQ